MSAGAPRPPGYRMAKQFPSSTRRPQTAAGWRIHRGHLPTVFRHEEALFQQATELARTNMRFGHGVEQHAPRHQHVRPGTSGGGLEPAFMRKSTRRRQICWRPEHISMPCLPISSPAAFSKATRMTPQSRESSKRWINARPIRSGSRNFQMGRLILVSRQPMAGGGWVSTHEDITERRRAGGRDRSSGTA